MKPGLAVLPLEVWADVFESITRQELAQFLDEIRNRSFANKLEKLLHGCGKQSLRFLQISSRPPDKLSNNSCKYPLRKRKIVQPERKASLAVSAHAIRSFWSPFVYKYSYKNCEFPATEMPENITKFKRISIRHLDDQVLDFLTKIKPLLNNVLLHIDMKQSQLAKNMCILFDHLFPLIGSIRGIRCNEGMGLEVLGQHFPDIFTSAKELNLFARATSIAAYLEWLNAPQDFELHGPRFLKLYTNSKKNIVSIIVNAVREQFMTATSPATIVIFLAHYWHEHHAEEFKLENAATKELLTVRNETIIKFEYEYQYVEILRYPVDAEAKMREWVEQRVFNEKRTDREAVQVIHIAEFPTIGHISKKAANAVKHGEDKDESADEDEHGPSTSAAKKMKK